MNEKEHIFTANPNYYDYIKEIYLKYDKIEMVYGECQGIRYEATGEYKIKYMDKESGILTIKRLKEKHSDNIEIYNDFDIKFKKEKGCFILKKEIMWKVDDLDIPYLVAYERFLFEKDPFDLSDENNKTIFYKSWSESTKKELVENNIINNNEINKIKL